MIDWFMLVFRRSPGSLLSIKNLELVESLQRSEHVRSFAIVQIHAWFRRMCACLNALIRLLIRHRITAVTYTRLALGSFDNYRPLAIRVVAVAGKR